MYVGHDPLYEAYLIYAIPVVVVEAAAVVVCTRLVSLLMPQSKKNMKCHLIT
jgi:hypothetical protein